MSIYLKRYGLAVTKFNSKDTGISGSARFQNILSWFDEVLQPKMQPKIFKEAEPIQQCVEVKSDRYYGVNKKRLMDRLNAYVCLSRSRKFLAFYSVSFPSGTSDEVIGRIWNSCLTSLREKLSMRSYIWVMERQRNGTIHYHMLTNDYMPIRGFNAIVAECIDYYAKKGMCSWGNSSVALYNGVDVENISKRVSVNDKNYARRAYSMVISYVTKYMSKNSEKEKCRQWHCSRVVSALFVTACLTPDEANILFECDEEFLKNRRIVESEHASIILFSAIDSTTWADTIGRWNEKVYKYFEEHSLW